VTARARAREAVPEGLLYRPDFLTEEEEAGLLAAFEGMAFREVRMRDRTARRTVAHFGMDYDYESFELTPAEPIPESLAWLRERCAGLAEVDPESLVEALVTRYPPGATIGWHRDAPSFGGKVIGVSLLSDCRMRFQRTGPEGREVHALPLSRRSAYVLAGQARWSWQHSIPATPGLRYSVTFRSLRARRPLG
jgi:DNA oxidative demethylase